MKPQEVAPVQVEAADRFTADAVIDSNGTLYKGHDEIRKVVTGLIERNADNKAKGLPAVRLYHMISNVRISFQGKDEALYQSYWQTVRHGKDNPREPESAAQAPPPYRSLRDDRGKDGMLGTGATALIRAAKAGDVASATVPSLSIPIAGAKP